MAFRVPPLRNVAETAPYFYDHSARSLRRAIWDIALREQGMHLDLAEVTAIGSFLKSLTGKLPASYIKPPVAIETQVKSTSVKPAPAAPPSGEKKKPQALPGK